MKENLDLELQTKANLASELQTIFEQRKASFKGKYESSRSYFGQKRA